MGSMFLSAYWQWYRINKCMRSVGSRSLLVPFRFLDLVPCWTACADHMGRHTEAATAHVPELQAAVAFVLIDGLGDVHMPDLNHLTPLEAADTKAMDATAAAGVNGLLDPVEPGLACGSDTAHLSIFGYDPRIYYRGRGAFESMGAGINMVPGDIAFKCNFAVVEPASQVVLKRRADRHFEVAGPTLCAALNGLRLPSFPGYRISVKYATEHRCGVVVSGTGLSDQISGTDPLKDNLPLQEAKPLDDSLEAAHTAAVVNELSGCIQQVLAAHPINIGRQAEGKLPANVVLLRGCGSRIAVQPFQDKHGMRACMVAPTKIIAGLGMSLGIDRLEAPGTTGDYGTQLHVKAEVIARALSSGQYDFGFLHVKAVDDAGHDRQPVMKVRYLESVDLMVQQLTKRLCAAEKASGKRFMICITGDHSTPVLTGDHSHEPVPFALAHIQHVVACMGGEAALSAVQLGAMPHQPGPQQQPGLQQLAQAALQRRSNACQTDTALRFGDAVTSFSETEATVGLLGRFPGNQVMPMIRAACSMPDEDSMHGQGVDY